jgi:four helix bundle protein
MYNELPMENVVNTPVDLRDRTLEFSRLVIRFLKQIPRDPLVEPIRNQIVRSATSIGANFVEAKDSGSRRDFRNKVLICKKEAAEALYWLKLLEEFTDKDELGVLQGECQEIILILQKIINTLGH